MFLGTGDFAVPSLKAVAGAGHELAAVITQPDREKGRGRKLTPPPVKPAAETLGLAVLQPRRIREAVETVREQRAEVLVVVAYGQILPRAVLEAAPRGAINVHGSLLPRWRGAAPIQWAIAAGDAETGVTTMLLDEGLDTGPILLSESTPIGAEETAADLSPRLAAMGAELLVKTLAGLEDGSVRPRPQDAAKATVARLLEKEDGRLDWSLSAAEIARRIRGFHPWPGVYASLDGRIVKILRARAAAAPASGGDSPPNEQAPGTVVRVDPEGVVVAAGASSLLRLVEVQPESRNPASATAFAQGARLQPGKRFD